MNLYLARHTETNYNVTGLSNSKPEVNVYLTEKGRQQAIGLAEHFRNIPIDIVYTSGLSRTSETAKYIIDDRLIPIHKDTRLDDHNMGFEGKPVDEYHKLLAETSDRWAAKFNDGESLNDLLNRVDDFLTHLKSLPYSNVLIISHYTVLQLMLARLDNKDIKDALTIPIEQGNFVKRIL